MKKFLLLFSIIFTFSHINAQILNRVSKMLNADSAKKIISSVSKSPNQLSSDDIISGLKEALSVGTNNASKMLGTTDGYFANAAVKILMPDEAKKVEKTLRQFGMSSLVDKAILSMNRAAEDAASGVGSIFLDGIKQMTIADGLAILKGGDNSATEFLKKTTATQLKEKMRPVIEASLVKTDATKYWNDVFTQYNKFSAKKINPDLADYVTSKAMDGIFYQVAQEETKIRKDPAAQVTDLLKKVFGN
jgi:hypothetical protein